MDADRVLSLARYLGKCKSTPDLSCTAVSLLSKTLIGRAARLESRASRVHLAAEKERYRRTSASKRRKASGPKNMSEFMRETIRNRKSQGKARVSVRQKTQDRPDALAHPDDKALFRKRNKSSSRIVASFVVPPRVEAHNDGRSRCSTPVSMKQYHGPMSHVNGARSAGGVEGGSPHSCTSPPEDCSKEKRSQRLNLSPQREKCEKNWSLENDTDIRILLDRVHHPITASSNRPATAGHAVNTATEGDRSVSRIRPASSRGLRGRTQTRAGGGHDMRPSVSVVSKGVVLSSHSNADGLKSRPFLQHKMREEGRRGRSDVVQVRREMLIRSHGQGLNGNNFARDQFEATAMGRRAACYPGPTVDRSGRVRWLPAKTLNGLDRLERSRMLMNKRPVVTSLHVWT